MARVKKVNVQGKFGLARLLAVENLHVVHNPSATTASFDLRNRVVTLPILKDMNGYIYDAFIGHEIAHAIWTPPKEYGDTAEEMGTGVFINITEDARIERMIQDKYPGLRKDFYKFYKDLSSEERDFFGLKGRDVSKLSLVDKINLHFKIGSFVKIPFSAEEQPFVKMVQDEVTFDDAIAAAKAIFEYMKEKKQIIEISQDNLTYGDGEEGDEDGEEGQDGEEGDGSGKGKKFRKGGKGDKNGKARWVMADGSEIGGTQDKFNQSMHQLYEKANGEVICGDIFTLPKASFEKMVNRELNVVPVDDPSITVYENFINQIKPTVNMMASVFNMKKAAHDYQRTLVNKTGRLDMKRAQMYTIKSDVFKKNEMIPESKNHGMVMMIDWSGSMSDNIAATVKQLIILMEFCRKTQIPFEVYGFTNFGGRVAISPNPYEVFANQSSSALFLMFSHAMKKKEFVKNCKTILEAAHKGQPQRILSMNNTPLNMAAFLSKNVIESFKERTGVEKTVLVMLSDGEPTDQLCKSNQYISAKKIIMRDTKTNRNYTVQNSHLAYHGILEYVKEHCGINRVIGFYLTNSLQSSSINLMCPDFKGNTQTVLNEFKQKKVVCMPKSQAFDKYYGISIDKFEIDNSNPFDNISSSSSKAAITQAFEQRMTNKANSMVFLKDFVEIIS